MAEEEEQITEAGEEVADETEMGAEEDMYAGEEGEEEEEAELKKKDERKDKLMKEYMDLITEIASQNKCVNDLKGKICQKCQKKCMTKCEEREIQNLRCCLERENLKLQCLIKRAMTLQEEDPTEPWDEIEIATTFGEDRMPVGFSYNVMQAVCKKTLSEEESDLCSPSPPCPSSPPCPPCPGMDSKQDLEKFLRCLLQKAGKKRKKPSHPCLDDGGTMLEFDDDMIDKILCAVQGQKPCGAKKPPCGYSKVCKELNQSYSMQEKLVQDNATLEGDRFKLQEEVLSRDKVIECLQRKIQTMQCDLQKLCREKQKLVKEVTCGEGDANPKTIERIKKYKQCTKALQKNIEQMQCSVERMKLEMDSLKRERDSWQGQVQDEEICTPKRKTKSNEIEELKKNYGNLLLDYCRKDSELKELQQRVKGFVDPCEKKGGGGEVDHTELLMLREKVNDLQEEQEEFKCLIKEQSSQMEDYRNKFLIAQQKVEEQKCIIEKLEMNNKRIEDQINLEIQRIKSKFQEKLKELAQLPKLLENEQMKLATACKEKEDLEQKLRLVCKELKALKAQQTKGSDDPNLAARLKQAEHDLAVLQRKYDELKADKDVLCVKLEKALDDLDTLRTESARIIARTKERAESQRETLQSRIDKLERDLAQCRATASISISDREEVIKEMKGQLCQLSYSFDSAQKQIKTLKNHIVYLSNENCYPVKC